MKKKPSKPKGLRKLRAELWSVFREFIKARDKCICFTCGKLVRGQNCHAGHFITGATCPPPLYFDEHNVHCQCYRCNVHLSGNWVVYEERLRYVYGDEIVDELKRRRGHSIKWTRQDYEDMILEYRDKVKALVDRAL